MMKKFKKQINNEKGLTLIELLAVIVILAIIAAIAVPAIGKVISNSQDKALLADASNILAGAKIAMVDGSCGNDNECDIDELAEYVEGVTGVTKDEAGKDVQVTYSVKIVEVKDEADQWTVTYSGFENIKNVKYTDGISSPGNTISEADLNELMR